MMASMKPLQRIMVATDFSAAAQAAVTRAGQLAHQHNAEVLMLHVAPDWNLFSRWTTPRQEQYDALIHHARRQMRHEFIRILNTFGVQGTSDVQLGKASEVIGRTIGQYRPDLVITGARGEHEPTAAPGALGGTALKVYLRGGTPLLLVKHASSSAYRTSLAALHETSEISRRLIDWSTVMIADGDCHLFHAHESAYLQRLRLCNTPDAVLEACEETTGATARAAFDALLKSLPAHDRLHLHLHQGKPLDKLVAVIDQHDPQLLVVGKCDGGPNGEDQGGTVGLRMAYHTPVDTLVVPPGAARL
jgi:universal stress protein E